MFSAKHKHPTAQLPSSATVKCKMLQLSLCLNRREHVHRGLDTERKFKRVSFLNIYLLMLKLEGCFLCKMTLLAFLQVLSLPVHCCLLWVLCSDFQTCCILMENIYYLPISATICSYRNYEHRCISHTTATKSLQKLGTS